MTHNSDTAANTLSNGHAPAGRTIVVLVHQALGDAVMVLPLLRVCENNLGPRDRLILVARRNTVADLLAAIPWKVNVEIWNTTNRGWGRKFWHLTLLLRLRRIEPDILLAPMLVDRLTNALWLQWCGAKVTAASGKRWLERIGRCRAARPQAKRHRVEEYLELGRAAGLSGDTEPDMRIPISEEQKRQAQPAMSWWRPDRRWIVLAPGCGIGELPKRYPAAGYRELARLLLAHAPDIGIIALGTNEESDLVHSILNDPAIDRDRCAAATGLRIADLLVLLSRSRCIVAGCSGSTHLGAALGIPVVGLYGPTNPGYTGAYGRNLRVVRLGLKCSPCQRVNQLVTGCGNPICMTMLPPETVFEAVRASLAGEPCPPVPWCANTGARHAIPPQTPTATPAASRSEAA